jgi:hypothetical protein
MAAHELHLATRTIQGIREQAYQGLIRGGIHRWRGDFDAQLVAKRFANSTDRRAWLEFDRNQNSAGLNPEETR